MTRAKSLQAGQILSCSDQTDAYVAMGDIGEKIAANTHNKEILRREENK
jgi:hypothetical protein